MIREKNKEKFRIKLKFSKLKKKHIKREANKGNNIKNTNIQKD